MSNKIGNAAPSPNETHASPVAPPVARQPAGDPSRSPSQPAAPGGAGSTEPRSEAEVSGDPAREDRIREEAYRRFEARKGDPGDPVTDWLDAEAEIDRPAGPA